MNSWTQRNFCLLVTGFPPDIDRKTLKNEFTKFGDIEKLYLDNSGRFAKVFYGEKECSELAIQEINNSSRNWKIKYCDSSYTEKSPNSLQSNRTRMARYNEYYEDDDFSENYEYCNVHGQPLVVLQADSGEFYINLNDVRKTGFAIFRRDTFDSVLVDKRQIGKEFELHLLSEAKNYILRNKVTAIGEKDILQTIERCRMKLVGEGDGNSSGARNNFGAGRSVAHSPGSNILVTADVHRTSSHTNFSTPHTSNQRLPKALPNNFMPTNTQRNERHRTKSQDRGARGNREFKNNNSFTRDQDVNNGFGSESDSSKQNVEQKPKPNFFELKPVRKPQAEISASNNKDQKRTPYFKEEISKLTLDVGTNYQVQIVSNEEKENICWVQKREDASAVEEILLQINEMEADLENINPQVGQLVMAQFEGVWSRGQVTKVNPPVIYFIDYGNRSGVKSVKPLPDAFKKIPAMAARIMISKQHKVNEGVTQIHIRVKQQYDDGTYLVDLVDTVSTSSDDEKILKPFDLKKIDPPKQKLYFDIPKPIGKIKNGDKIMVVDSEDNKFLVRTIECAHKSKELTAYIKNLDKSALVLSDVKVGQLVLCSKDGLVGLYRAVITKKESASVVTVKYVDFPGEDDLSIKSLRNVDEFLSTEPASIMLSPEFDGLRKADERVAEYISNICRNKEKCTVILSDGDFDLQLNDDTLLSEKLIELKTPKKLPEKTAESIKPISKQTEKPEKKPEEKAHTAKETRITFDDMDWIDIESGTHSFMCYRFKDISDITMISATEEAINHLEKVTGLEPADDAPYEPQEFEMCLVSFKAPEEEEASWFRAAVLSVENDDYEMTFVDFGNQEKIKSEDIRKFPLHLKKTPMLGINCELVGIPDTPEIVEHLKLLIREGDQLDVNVKGLSDLRYQIEIPAVYEKLKSKGLY